MRKQQSTNILIAISSFSLIIIFLILGLLLHDTYDSLTKPYFNFLNKIGYYQHIYRPDCHGRRCIENIPHAAPYLFFVMLPVVGGIFALYGYLGNNKTVKSLSAKKAKKISKATSAPTDLNDKKQDYFSYGIVAAYFFLIGIFIILPLLLVLFTL